jgi:hypothetical protein
MESLLWFHFFLYLCQIIINFFVMETIVNDSNMIEYDIFKTLYLIKTDEDLYSVYSTFTSKSINELISDIKNDSLDDKLNNTIYDIFESIILVEEKYIEIYEKITHDFGIVIKKPEQTINVDVSKSKLPRRYGKDKVLNDIKKDNRKATQAEKTMIALNNIKNLYCILERKLINDIFVERNEFDGSKILEDEEYRDIIALQELMSNKLKNIIKKK